MRKYYFLTILIMLVFFNACTTVDNINGKNAFTVYGMVYNKSGAPVANARIILNEQIISVSDYNGRFSIPEMNKGTYSVSIEADKYENYLSTVEILSTSDVVYVSLISTRELIISSKKALDSRDWELALIQIERALKIEPKNPEVRYLKALILNSLKWNKHNSEAAKLCLESLINDGFDEPYIVLFLLDIYQYDMNDMVAAQILYEKYKVHITDLVSRTRERELTAK